MHLVLASSSPRRKEILSQLNAIFTIVIPSDDAELPLPCKFSEGSEAAECNAVLKARSTARYTDKESVILAADTVVVSPDGLLLGKPVDREDVIRMLGLLSGKTHQVITGVAALNTADGKEHSSLEVTDVLFAELTRKDMEKYADSEEPMDKAGAYAIQGLGSRFIKSISGCFFNVVGLPVYRSLDVLKKVYPRSDEFFSL